MTLILEWGDRVKQEGSLSAKDSGSFARGRGQEKWPSICDFMGLWADVVGVSAIVWICLATSRSPRGAAEKRDMGLISKRCQQTLKMQLLSARSDHVLGVWGVNWAVLLFLRILHSHREREMSPGVATVGAGGGHGQSWPQLYQHRRGVTMSLSPGILRLSFVLFRIPALCLFIQQVLLSTYCIPGIVLARTLLFKLIIRNVQIIYSCRTFAGLCGMGWNMWMSGVF